MEGGAVSEIIDIDQSGNKLPAPKKRRIRGNTRDKGVIANARKEVASKFSEATSEEMQSIRKADESGAVEAQRIRDEILESSEDGAAPARKKKVANTEAATRDMRIELVARMVARAYAKGWIYRICYDKWNVGPETAEQYYKAAKRRLMALASRHTANVVVYAVAHEISLMRNYLADYEMMRDRVKMFLNEMDELSKIVFGMMARLSMLSETETDKLTAMHSRIAFLKTEINDGIRHYMLFSREAGAHRRRLDELAGILVNRNANPDESIKIVGSANMVKTPHGEEPKTQADADTVIANLYTIVAGRMKTYGIDMNGDNAGPLAVADALANADSGGLVVESKVEGEAQVAKADADKSDEGVDREQVGISW